MRAVLSTPQALRRARRENQRQFWSRLGVTASCGARYEGGRPMPNSIRMLVSFFALGTLDEQKLVWLQSFVDRSDERKDDPDFDRVLQALSDPRGLRRSTPDNQREFWGRVGVEQSAGSRYELDRELPRPVAILVVAYVTDTLPVAALESMRIFLKNPHDREWASGAPQPAGLGGQTVTADPSNQGSSFSGATGAGQ